MARKRDFYQIPLEQNIVDKNLESVIRDSMMPYAEHVILERALPRVEDGLKPVQRRILYTMSELGIFPDKPHRKCARIVGDCLGKYHPHGDSSVYDALVRMAQDFVMRDKLIDGQGNFGTIDGDCAAAMRYTEARLAPLAMELLRDLEKDTVTWSYNFDDTLKEPDVLPGRFPNLLVNGASGIAVGLSTNIPTHNLGEVIDGIVAQIDNPRITLDDMMTYVKAPDFPTGGYILDSPEIRNVYETGRGKIVVRAKVVIENASNGKKNIVIEEMPFQVNKKVMLEGILKLREDKKDLLSGIADIRDESDRNGMRAVIEIRRDADAEKILKYLYKYSDLQVNFSANMIAIAEGKPRQMGLLEINRYYIEYQKKVVTRRTRYDLDAAKAREHILQGLLIAIHNIDKVIRIIRASKTVREARDNLRSNFDLSEKQATAILEMRLQRLTNLEVITLENELKSVQDTIKYLEAILGSKRRLMEVIKSELLALKKKYRTPRRTQIIKEKEELSITHSDMKVVEDVVVCSEYGGSVKMIPLKSYSRSSSADTGKTDMVIRCMTATKNNSSVIAFTDKGNAYLAHCSAIPECKRRDKGSNKQRVFAGIDADETVLAIFPEEKIKAGGELVFVTRDGMVKKSKAEEYAVRKSRFAAITLKDDDKVVYVAMTDPEKTNLLMISRDAMALMIDVNEVSATGRTTAGVKGILLEEGDEVLTAALNDATGEVVTMSDMGFAKRTFAFEYAMSSRARKGSKTFDFKKNGSNGQKLVYAEYLNEPTELVVQTKDGTVSTYRSENIWLGDRMSGGKMLVMVLLDNIITFAQSDLS
ncbi:MAG: DNA topoisomerase 4 subunit A [Eubacteriales bacterium]|nr:DNA topoisomerase 4 subunit A [Eubacteriales bacterium]